MDTSDRGRKRREVIATREVPESVPPPARRRKVRNELDPELLWDKETDEQVDEYEVEDEGFGESGEDESYEDNMNSEDIDDWDHPIRRLKIN